MRLATAALVAGTLLGFGLAAPSTAFADETSDLQSKVEETSKEYQEAQDHLDEVQQSIDENQEKIDEIEAQLPELEEEAAASIVSSYKMQQSSGGLIELILSSENFSELISTMNYLDIIAGKNNQAMEELVDAEKQLQETQDTLAAQKSEAEKAKDEAEQAMEDAIAARDEAQEKAAEELAAQQEEAEQAVEEARVAEESGETTFTTSSGNTATVDTSEDTSATSDTSEVTWSERDEFVSTWAARIDAYLAGSPLAGYGETFAEAAYDYGVDPRYSPAIANVESSKGLYCFNSHNAWGYGNYSWSDWDTAIRAHVAGLASGYGYTVSVTAAQKYCPSNWQFWYSSVLSNMNSI